VWLGGGKGSQRHSPGTLAHDPAPVLAFPAGLQNFRLNLVGGVDLLSSVARLLWLKDAPTVGYLGAYRDESNPPFYGWSWVDDTNASNLNCGSTGCGIFSPDQPK
jgi:hypothetical protein